MEPRRNNENRQKINNTTFYNKDNDLNYRNKPI